jgi:hypothetical protein
MTEPTETEDVTPPEATVEDDDGAVDEPTSVGILRKDVEDDEPPEADEA